LKEGVLAEVVGIVAVGVAGQVLIDLLDEQALGGVLDEQGRARVGKSLGQAGQDAQGTIQGANGQKAGIGDEESLVEGHL
jgi:hypothetical protein